MKKNQSIVHKVSGILNTSSETFMLIALIGLFAMPFVIAKNLEPVVRQSESSSGGTARTIVREYDNSQSLADNGSDRPDVLGVSTSTDPVVVETKELSIIEDTVNLKYFDSYTSTPTDNKYSLQIATTQVFGKIPVFTLTNKSTDTQAYSFSVEDAETESTTQKYLYVENMKYEVNSPSLPEVVNLEPGDTITFSLANNSQQVTNLTITVEVLETN